MSIYKLPEEFSLTINDIKYYNEIIDILCTKSILKHYNNNYYNIVKNIEFKDFFTNLINTYIINNHCNKFSYILEHCETLFNECHSIIYDQYVTYFLQMIYNEYYIEYLNKIGLENVTNFSVQDMYCKYTVKFEECNSKKCITEECTIEECTCGINNRIGKHINTLYNIIKKDTDKYDKFLTNFEIYYMNTLYNAFSLFGREELMEKLNYKSYKNNKETIYHSISYDNMFLYEKLLLDYPKDIMLFTIDNYNINNTKNCLNYCIKNYKDNKILNNIFSLDAKDIKNINIYDELLKHAFNILIEFINEKYEPDDFGKYNNLSQDDLKKGYDLFKDFSTNSIVNLLRILKEFKDTNYFNDNNAIMDLVEYTTANIKRKL